MSRGRSPTPPFHEPPHAHRPHLLPFGVFSYAGGVHTAGVKQRHLETVLPARGGKVVVVRGEERGATGKLLAKDKDKETALVQVCVCARARVSSSAHARWSLGFG